MKNLNQYIIERLKLNKDTKILKFFPRSFDELRKLLEQLLEERGPDADLNDINVSNITTFCTGPHKKGLFKGLDPHNIKIDKWDVNNATNMFGMFDQCENFNCNLSKWDVSNVENMKTMFNNCYKFTGQGLDNWKVDQVKDMGFMFSGCKNFDCNLSDWDVSKVEDMGHMFDWCTNFEGNGLEKWHVDNVKNMVFMFFYCKKFKGNGLENWTPIKCPKYNMDDMFKYSGVRGKNRPSWYKE